MQSELSLIELAQLITDNKAKKQDYIASTRSLTMQQAGEKMEVRMDGVDTPLEVSELAHAQIADRVKIPALYYNRMKQEAPSLLTSNVNHWFHHKSEKRMVRTLDGKLRAFLSDRYQRIEHEQIAEAVLPELHAQSGIKIVSCAITERKLYIQAVFSKIEGEVKKGDVVQSGIVISNSEVGHGAVSIEPMVYRLVCDNGMILPDSSYRRHHVGGRIGADENIQQLLSSEALMADDKALLLKIRDVVRASFNEVRFAEHLSRMKAAAGEPLRGNPVEAVTKLSTRLTLSSEESGSVLRHLIEGGDLTQWGMVNAVTRTAQDVKSYDRAVELETAGGVVLNLSPREWQPIAQAA